MKLFLMGASGMIGSRILAEAVARGHEVVAGARNPDKIAALSGVTPVKVEATDAAALAEYAKPADAFLFSVSPRSTGDAVAEAEGFARAVIPVAEKTGTRVVVVGGAASLKLPDGSAVLDLLPDFVRPEATGFIKFRKALEASEADWTFFAPAITIEPGERTGTYRLGTDTAVLDAEGNGRISAEARQQSGITEALLRVAVGLESVEDIYADLISGLG